MTDLKFEFRVLDGCVGIVVDAKPESLSFYQELGFLTLQSDELNNSQIQPLFMVIKIIQQAISK